MNKQDKIFEVENLKAKIQGAKLIALADYKGVNVTQINQLRDQITEAGGEMQVVKNRLFSRALRLAGIKLSDKDLNGTTAVVFANTDEVGPLKALFTFAKNASLFPFKFGYVNTERLEAESLERFASLPTKEQLGAKLIGLLVGPQYRLVYALKYNLNRLVYALDAVKNQKS